MTREARTATSISVSGGVRPSLIGRTTDRPRSGGKLATMTPVSVSGRAAAVKSGPPACRVPLPDHASRGPRQRDSADPFLLPSGRAPLRGPTRWRSHPQQRPPSTWNRPSVSVRRVSGSRRGSLHATDGDGRKPRRGRVHERRVRTPINNRTVPCTETPSGELACHRGLPLHPNRAYAARRADTSCEPAFATAPFRVRVKRQSSVGNSTSSPSSDAAI